MEYASNIIFKACVNRNDGTSFKQYVALNKRGECTYECLRVKLMNEFPCLSRKPFSIKWMGNIYFIKFKIFSNVSLI